MWHLNNRSCEICNKCPKWLIGKNSSYSDYFNATSGFTSNSRAPGGPVTITKQDEFLCKKWKHWRVFLNGLSPITALQRSYGKVVFSVVSVSKSFCPQGEDPMWSLSMMHWTSPYRDPLSIPLPLSKNFGPKYKTIKHWYYSNSIYQQTLKSTDPAEHDVQ